MPCGAFGSTIVVPELQIWSNRFIVDSAVNKNEVPYPPETPEVCFPPGSFITMLFNEDYDLDYYKYLYASKRDRLAWPYVIKHRLLVYPLSGQYYVIPMPGAADSGSNIFQLGQDDFTMLDALLAYRMDSTSVDMIDSTANIFIKREFLELSHGGYLLIGPSGKRGRLVLNYNSSADTDILLADFNSLSTELSKLIYVYLDLKINYSVRYYNTATPISTTNPLAYRTIDPLTTIYELFVLDKCFEFLAANSVDPAFSCRTSP